MDTYQKIKCGLMLIDLSGFTQLLYHASYKEEIMQLVLKAIQLMFENATKAANTVNNVQIINTTGDGFIAMITGETPSRTAIAYAKIIEKQFNTHVKRIMNSVPFRQRIELRIALHYGVVYKIDIKGYGNNSYPVFIGDDINLLARVINSQIARRFVIALTRTFFKRLIIAKDNMLPTPDEVILDRNRYPEQIEIYRMPKDIPEYIPKQKRIIADSK